MKKLANVTAVAIGGRGLLIAGPSGSGKSSLALELIDRGAHLIGDDGIVVEGLEGRLIVHPPGETGGLIEIRNVGIIELEPVSAPACLWITLAKDPPRLPVGPEERWVAGHPLPELRIFPSKLALALRVEAALGMHGLSA
ncbi:HPr kinase/phosphorylase [Pseudoblastomonas halimionae]|uniref:Serine kinase n=1 Tax=Alteriqipengyuania halimionae TaxID=1926630 RepID=A0A6I4U2K1_9SPHN|nr:serine kinase [Alteriqipengyuania halimionae]MXP09946.1 serine kinase [Alteriqipengyuania halimionae]